MSATFWPFSDQFNTGSERDLKVKFADLRR
jgi:hypothetical protein